MKIGFIIPKDEDICYFPLYEEIKKSKKLASKKNHPLSKFNLIGTSSRGVSYKPSIGVLTLGKLLQESGHEVNILHQDYEEAQGNDQNMLEKMIEESDIIGINTQTVTYEGAKKYLSTIKELRKDLPVVAGGPHVSFTDATSIQDGFDFVIRGYADGVIQEFIEKVKEGKGFENISGLTYKDGDKIIRNPIKKITKEEIKSPNYDLLPKGMKANSSIPLFTSRGCPFSCNFCVENGMYKLKAIDAVLEDIAQAKKNFPFNNYFLSDSVFGIDNKHTRELIGAINKNFPELYFFYQNRVDLINPDMVEYLTKNNFIGVWVGLESLSNPTLELMGKGEKETYENFLQTLREIKGITPYIEGSFIIGYPGDTKESLHLTMERLEGMLDENILTSASARLYVPYPGTMHFQNPEKYGLTINEKDYSKFTRHSFPPNFRTKEFSEFELYTTMLEFNALVSRCLHNRNQMNTYDSIDLTNMTQYEGK